jgi:uncharacterized protein YcgL (UPF0745 family)
MEGNNTPMPTEEAQKQQLFNSMLVTWRNRFDSAPGTDVQDFTCPQVVQYMAKQERKSNATENRNKLKMAKESKKRKSVA